MMSGGPRYHLLRRRKNQRLCKFLGMLFAAIAAFGIGKMVQSNSVADAMHGSFSVPHAAMRARAGQDRALHTRRAACAIDQLARHSQYPALGAE